MPRLTVTDGTEVLKLDSLGRVEMIASAQGSQIRRVACGGKIPGSRLLARFLARHEQRIMLRLAHVPGLPRAFGSDEQGFYRSYVEGVPLYEAGTVDSKYFDQLFDLLDAVHGADVTHNDLAKEANIIVTPQMTPALVDFQIALWFPPRRGPIRRRLFAMLRREDRRHLLKQKRVHRPDLLTAVEMQLLARKSLPVRLWSATLMKPYQRMLCRFGLEPARGPHGR